MPKEVQSSNANDEPKKDVVAEASARLMATPGLTVQQWPFWLGFGVIDFLGAEVFKMLPIESGSAGANIFESLYRGMLTTTKFSYYTGEGHYA